MEKSYGILMKRDLISPGIYLFTPLYIIEGTLEREYYEETDIEQLTFTDSIMGFEYLTINDGESTTTDEEQVIGYIISKSELQKLYPKVDIEEAKSLYFDEITENIHIGFYQPDYEKIVVKKLDLNKLSIEINNQTDSGDYIDDSYILGNESKHVMNDSTYKYNNQEVITIELDKFEQLLEINNYSQLIEQLRKIYNTVIEMKNEYLDNTDVIDSEYILTIFNDAYTSLLNINDINTLKKIMENLEDMYVELTLKLEDMDKEKSLKANEFLYEFIDKYHILQQYDDIDKIKLELTKIMQREEKRINKIAEMYDNESSVETKQEEIEIQEEQPQEKINVKEIKKYFDEKIIGQEEAKKDVISAIVMNKLSDNPSSKNNCLLVGPTGSGKTLLAEAVSKYFDMPMEIIDTTQITVPGYVGASIEDFLARLVIKAGSVEKAEQGIVVFDEIDKKGTDSNGDVNGKGVLNTLLPFIQGTTYDVKVNNRTQQFNTSKLTIFATGAFTDVAAESDNNYTSNNIGFNSTNKKPKEDIEYKKLEIEDFVKYGNMPIELMGRFSVITQLTGHTIESLKQILTLSNESALLIEKEKLNKINIELRWTEGYLDSVANQAIKLKTGARSLKSTVEKSIKEARWEVLNNLDIYRGIILTEKSVNDNLNCSLIDLNGNIHNLKDIIDSKDKTELVLVKK